MSQLDYNSVINQLSRQLGEKEVQIAMLSVRVEDLEKENRAHAERQGAEVPYDTTVSDQPESG